MLNFSASLPLGCFDPDPSDSRGGDFSWCPTGTTDIPARRPAQSSDPRSVWTLSFVCLGLYSNTQNKTDAQVLKLRWPRFHRQKGKRAADTQSQTVLTHSQSCRAERLQVFPLKPIQTCAHEFASSSLIHEEIKEISALREF